LRLSGFKSFVDPTELYIERGLTGIVGPNGCGKSNLVEALRWAMGETSAKRMRGGEMDDVIFGGTAGRPARNIAEVALHLDNSDRSAPAAMNDGDELEVVRRIERGSGSHYRVSSREVRAKDVQLLFADSATGAHSTALVSQGRVGALINAKPTDRRALLEEAAGITGLHSRRHEAELRLRAAETNLERLDDVIATLESQHHGLKKQARQATRYRNLAGHIRRNEAIALHLENQQTQLDLKRAEESLAAAEAAVAALTQNTAAAATEQAATAAALPELRQSEAAAAAGLQRLLVERDNLDREEAQVVAAQERVRQHLAQIEGDRARGREQAKDAGAALTRLDSEAAALRAAAAAEGESRRHAEAQRDTAAELVAEREAALDRESARVASDEAQAAALERRIAELRERLERLKSQAERIAEERAALEAERENDHALAEAQAALAESESRLGEARQEAERTADDLNTARQEENAAREAWQMSRSEEAKLEAEIKALSAMLEAGQGDIWPPILDTLTVEPGFESALGSALGDDLGASADEAAPVHWETLPPYGNAQALPPGAEPLDRFVTGPAALNRRLSQTGLVADEATGKRLQLSLAAGQSLVTRDGALWRWDGYTAKAEAPTAAATRLEQRNHLADLRKALPEASSKTVTLEAAFRKTCDRAEAVAAEERAARERLDAAFGAVTAARDGKAELAQRAAAAVSRLSALAETAERLTGEISETEAALEEAARDLAALPDLAAARAKLTELRAELAEKRVALADCQGAVDHLRRESEARSRRLEAIEQEKDSWARRADEAQRHLDALEGRQSEAQHELDALAARPVEIAEKRETLAGEIAGAEGSRQTAADALAEGETRLAAADRALKAEEQKLAQAREDRVRHDSERGHCREAVRNLAERVREKLDCDVAQLLEVAEADPSQELPTREEVETKLARLVRERDNMGPVNLRAEQEAAELDQQITEMQTERADLISAIGRLRQGIAGLNREGRQRLLAAFEKVNEHFSELFVRLFGGGHAHLQLTEADDPLEAGLEIMASPPGKRLQVLSLLSGGEQALTAIALLFAVFQTNPAPICVLDEVDAPLDDANVDRFCCLVEQLAEETSTRFLVITHHRITMARMHRLFGVTMAERGVSQLVSVDLEAAEELREIA
jgi:chromosome segregation protein